MNHVKDKENSVPDLINQLAGCLSEDEEELQRILQSSALHFITICAHNVLHTTIDESRLVEDIRSQIAQKNEQNAIKFDGLYQKIKDVKNYTHQAELLRFMSLLSKEHLKSDDDSSLNTDIQISPIISNDKPKLISSTGFDQKSCNVTPKYSSTPITSESSMKSVGKYAQNNRFPLVIPSAVSSNKKFLTFVGASSLSTHGVSLGSQQLAIGPGKMSERNLVEQVVFAFQGIDGKVLKREPGSGGFIVDTRVGVDRAQHGMILRLAELGFLHNQVRRYCDNIDNRFGIIGQCFVSALQAELSDYYKMVAELQSSLGTDTIEAEMTLRRLMVWSVRPIARMTLLADLTAQCELKKGGELISTVFLFTGHGAPDFKFVGRRILKTICTPLLRVLTRWLLDGLLEDPCSEFFIETRPISKTELLWHSKYHLRPNMIPGFISPNQARQILVTGKSINFLRDVCNDVTNIVAKASIQRTFENMNVEALFVPELSSEFRKTLEMAYRNTSQRVLDVMREEYKLIQHIQAFRRFLLLGQGDFVQILMELLAPELSKPANEIYAHTLAGILDNAIRSSNAQYEDEDILNRLDIRLMEFCSDDFGWDVFTMLYHVEGPIGTIFEPVLECYRTLFSALWKAKRMEYVLSRMWKRQITSARGFRQLTEMTNVMHMVHVLTSEMVHFMQQTQYYFLFEVVECSWVEMLDKLNTAETLDDIIRAHKNFLDHVHYGVLFDPKSQELHTQLCTIYNIILKLEGIDKSMHNFALTELKQIKDYRKKLESTNLTNGFSVTTAEEKKYYEQRQIFSNSLQSAKAQVRSIEKQYKDYVHKYLQMLASNSDVTLQLLSVRLDFNGYYERAHMQK